MGIYLNSLSAHTLYRNEMRKPYFVDKTAMLEELFPLIREGSNYICVTRPRRFGKTVIANMISSFFGKGADSHEIFDRLSIADAKEYREYLNQWNVIHISFNEMPDPCENYSQYIQRIRKRLVRDLETVYGQSRMDENDAVWDILSEIYETTGGEKFIFVLDEWDYIFHQDFAGEKDKKAFLLFLRNLLKDKPYISLVYMTGILPIAKYSSGSELNMFLEYTMVTEEKYCEYFGFTESEVDGLYEKYLQRETAPAVSREGLRYWYDGYHTRSGERVYNPRSVVAALSNNVVFIGMPGAGKSTVGVVLAKMLGYRFVDSDLVIQEKTGKLLYQLLDTCGLERFRAIENEVNAGITADHAVIATGGSAVYGREAMEHFREIAVVVYLKLSCGEIRERLGDLHERGVTMEPGQTLESLYQERCPLYEQYADVTVDCDGKSLREVARQVYDRLQGRE